MELDYTTLTDQELAKALAGNHVGIQNYWTQISELAGRSGKAQFRGAGVRCVKRPSKKSSSGSKPIQFREWRVVLIDPVDIASPGSRCGSRFNLSVWHSKRLLIQERL